MIMFALVISDDRISLSKRRAEIIEEMMKLSSKIIFL